jgi:hypothetical protein
MAIVTYAYYTQTYMGETVAETDFPRLEARAERIINQITHGRTANFAALPAVFQEPVKTAICAQIEYYALMGEDVAVTGEISNGWTVGRVHVNGSAKASAVGAASMVCPAAYAALEQTGLLNPQIPTLGEPWEAPWPWGVR